MHKLNEYQVSVMCRNLLTGEKQTTLQNAVITQNGRHQKVSIDLSRNDIDQIEIRKTVEDEEDVKETFQVILQEYRKGEMTG